MARSNIPGFTHCEVYGLGNNLADLTYRKVAAMIVYTPDGKYQDVKTGEVFEYHVIGSLHQADNTNSGVLEFLLERRLHHRSNERRTTPQVLAYLADMGRKASCLTARIT